MYGKSLQKNWKSNFSNTQIVENPEMLTKIEEMAQKESQTKVSSNATTYISTPVRQEVPRTSPAPAPTNKQIEVRLPDGKRRITPMLLTSVSTDSNR